ncbi:Fic family protein [Pseudomonas jilinensis]|uniref:Fic family protein n=1 Tax=Pseudomonas jilinensis TaxID=2078689 RepID=A0A396S249_9PSED|nr:Fic family protein [Pseudomonas jilinensis]RHW22951.1 Fic family protein [Pseudomonas jilinensis]
MPDDGLMRGKHWIEPCMPREEGWTEPMKLGVERMIRASERLSVLVGSHTRAELGRLLQITNSYYTNLIEGQHTEPADLAERRSARNNERLWELGVEHMVVQGEFEQRLAEQRPVWAEMFSQPLIVALHRELFAQAADNDLTLADGFVMVPGDLRSVSGREVVVGRHRAPASDTIESMLARLVEAYGRYPDTTHRLIAAMACHHRLAFIHPFPDGNGRVARLCTHLHLQYLDLASPLWSLSRGLAKRQSDYLRLLAAADAPRKGDLDGRGQLSESALCEFIEFMIDVSLDQMSYVESALAMETLGESIERAIAYADQFRKAGVKAECAQPLQVLFERGEMERAVFKRFTGMGDRLATQQLSALISCGVVEAPTPKSRTIYAGVPLWYAEHLFPQLHRRFRESLN